MDENGGKNRHFVLEGFTESEQYRSRQQDRGQRAVPERDRRSHGSALLGQVEGLKPELTAAREAQQEAGLESGFGIRVEFESFPDVPLAFERLDREAQGIELLNVRNEGERTSATVFVPDGKLEHFERLIRDYLEEKRDRAGRPRDNKKLVNAIEQVRAASLRSLWTDDDSAFPNSDQETFWWEVWLPIRGDRATMVETFRNLAQAQNFRVAPGELQFPERTVLLVHTSAGQMKRSMKTLNSIAELRRAKETAEFFVSLQPEEQPEWLSEMLDRTRFAGPSDAVPHVCLLDTGINNGHPLIAPQLADHDLHTVEPDWGTEDVEGHGTGMAGLILAGDLTEAMTSGAPVEISHRLESVKLLPHSGGNTEDPRHHGYLTIEAVARPEITEPHRRRVFSMAVTAKDNRDRGRPSAWSSAVDSLAADADGEGANPRLLMVAGGNIVDPNVWIEYPASNSTDGIHDPGQAWNALTVGACTDLIRISEPDTDDYQPVASRGGLSPFSTTSSTWQQQWPLKPDVVFEGGNVAKNALGAVSTSSLSLLTSHHIPSQRLFTTLNATSAATALAARMGGQLMDAYPQLWPESVRALIVHSAEWTSDMRRMFLPRSGRPSKNDYRNLIRHCGFGEPDLERALWSVSYSLTMVVQEQLNPFKREASKDPTLRDMNLHRLPWPLAELEALGETQVEMRVTLSYFIEPNPSERGFRSRYRYESHGLRFDVKRPQDSEYDFRARINAAARDEEEGTPSRGGDHGWVIGKQNRHKGSLHCDIWRGSAADLASRGVLAVYPALGWWKTRPRLERYDRAARYALIISISAPGVYIDLYNAVASQIPTPVDIEV
jgi:hypothetical protein